MTISLSQLNQILRRGMEVLNSGFPCNCNWNAELKKPSPEPLTAKQLALQANAIKMMKQLQRAGLTQRTVGNFVG